jgi:hypothetical protein
MGTPAREAKSPAVSPRACSHLRSGRAYFESRETSEPRPGARKGLGSGHMPQGEPLAGQGPRPAPLPGRSRPARRLQCGAAEPQRRARTGRHLPISAHGPRPAPSPVGQIILSLSQPDKITNANSIKSPLKVFNYQTVPKTKDSRREREAWGGG